MKKIFLFIAALCCLMMVSLPAEAGYKPEEIDGVIYGTFSSQTEGSVDVSVVSFTSNLSGEVVIKDYITMAYDDHTYWHKVTKIEEHSLDYIDTAFSVVCPSTLVEIKKNAFNRSTGLTSIKINPELQYIGMQAFALCTNLKSVNIPTNVTTLGNATFYGCSSLSTITLPGVRYIRWYAFKNCTSLVSVNAGNVLCPVEVVDDRAFENCTSLRYIRWASGKLKTIGMYAFAGCTSFEDFTIPSSVTEIREFAFQNAGLKVVRNNSTTPQKIQANVFDGVNLKRCLLYVPKGCKAAYQAADVWKEFAAILEPGEQPAEGAIVATGVQKVGNLYYDFHEDLTATVVKDASYKNLSGSIVVPETVTYSGNTYTVTEMRESAFAGCTEITQITLPNTLEAIPAGLFMGCTALKSIHLPSSLTSIGTQAFFYCTALNNITLPATLTTIRYGAFENCTALTSIRIPSGVDTIPEECFGRCSNLTKVQLMNGVKKIEEAAFARTGITSITLPASVNMLSKYAFVWSPLETVKCESETPPVLEHGRHVFNAIENTMDLYVPKGSVLLYKNTDRWELFRTINGVGANEKVQIDGIWYQLNEDFTAYVTYTSNGPDNYPYWSTVYQVDVPRTVTYKGIDYKVTAMGDNAFRYCTSLKKVTLPNTIKEIGSRAFGGCTSLLSVNIPSSVQILAGNAFEDTRIFENNIDANGAVYYDGCLLALTRNLPSDYTVKNGTRLIATWVFDNQPITSLTLPEGLEVLSNGALSDMANLKTISLPKSLNKIGNSFLHNCYVLQDIYNYASRPYDLSKVYCFDGLNQGACTLHVPSGSKSEYQEADAWQDFNVVGIPEEYTVTFVTWDDEVIKEETVLEGEAAHAPDAPEREGYTFCCWNVHFDNVQSDLTVKAGYDINDYTVRFFDTESPNPAPGLHKAIKAIDSQMVEYGQSAVAPEPPVLAGYTFVGWDKDFAIVKSDLDVYPLFVENAKVWTVTYIDNDKYGRTELFSELVEDGHDAQGYPAAHEGVKLWYWLDDDTWEHADLTNVTRNMTVQAYYTEITFHVTFRVDGDSTFAIDAIYGFNPNYIYYPHGTPKRASTDACDYEFTGWYPEVEFLTQDVTLEAQFKEIPHTYTISWNDENGALIDQTVVTYGEIPMHPDGEKAATAEKSYIFNGWTPEIVSATSDAAYQATYEEVDNCTVYYVDKEATELENEQLYLHIPEPPVIAGFTFLKWQTVAGDLADGITIQAIYQSNDPTSLPDIVLVPGHESMKLVRDGIVYVLTGDHIFTIQGQKVK